VCRNAYAPWHENNPSIALLRDTPQTNAHHPITREAAIDRSPSYLLNSGTICEPVPGGAFERPQPQRIVQPNRPSNVYVGAEFAVSNSRFLQRAQQGHYDFLDFGTGMLVDLWWAIT
jgi:hypothetical protein